MSDAAPASAPEGSKQPQSADGLEKTFENKLNIPSDQQNSKGTNPSASTFTPGKFNWADEVTTPTEGDEAKPATEVKTEAPAAQQEGDMGAAQKDGATHYQNGSEQLEEPAEYDVEVTLADHQSNPNDPLYSVKRFQDLELREELLQGITAMGYHKPSKIQERALALLLRGNNTNYIGQSQSGTGKTAAFTLNMLHKIDINDHSPQALVLAPTRELARQIAGVALTMGYFITEEGLKEKAVKGTVVEKGLLVGEAVPDPSKRGQQITGQIVAGTPGTVFDMIRRRQLNTQKIKILTLDEADNMLDLQGMGEQCQRINGTLPRDCQKVLMSATFPEQVLEFANKFAPNANITTLKTEELTVKGIKQIYMDCENDEIKYSSLLKIYHLTTVGSSIIFVKRRDTAHEINRRMTSEGHQVACLTGALEGGERDAVFQRFRRGEAKVLITTNVLARGIDVQAVTLVVNYDIPELGPPDFGVDYETYLHRIGRTGRFGRTGAAVTFIANRKDHDKFFNIMQHFGVKPDRLDPNDDDQMENDLKRIMKQVRIDEPMMDG
ncbi:hypothetical protein MBLNU230_g6640t1 [Neophaeotheca triangularis]